MNSPPKTSKSSRNLSHNVMSKLNYLFSISMLLQISKYVYFTYRFADEILESSEVKVCQVNHIKDFFPEVQQYKNPMTEGVAREAGSDRLFLPEASFVKEGNFVLQEKFYRDTLELESSLKFLRAGVRNKVYFKGEDVRVGIVTCGGLCPGLNVVIRSIVMSLWNDY